MKEELLSILLKLFQKTENAVAFPKSFYEKDYSSCLSGIHPKDANMVQHMQINQCDTSYQQNEEQKKMVISIDAEKHLIKSNIPVIKRNPKKN